MVMLGAIAGEIGKALQKDNERVALRTERAMDYLTKELLDEKKDRKNKLETVEEAIERLQSNGYDNVVAASIARGGVYAVQDAVTRAGEARKLGQNANDWYATTAEFSPDQFADMTTAQLANAVVDPVDLSFERFEGIEGIDKETYRSYMQEYGLAQPGQVSDTARVTVPDFKFDTDSAATLNIKDAYSAALQQRFMLEQEIAEGNLDETGLMQANTKLDALNTKVNNLRDYGIRSGIISDPGFSGSDTRVNFNLRLQSKLNSRSSGGEFGDAIWSTSENGVLIGKFDEIYIDEVHAIQAREAADYINDLEQQNMFGVDSKATMTAMGYKMFDITEDIVNSSAELNEDDIGKQAVNFYGHVAIIGD